MSEDDLFNKTVKSELSFKPVINKTPKYLTIEQIDAFKNLISNMTELSDRLEFVELEDYNYAKNILCHHKQNLIQLF